MGISRQALWLKWESHGAPQGYTTSPPSQVLPEIWTIFDWNPSAESMVDLTILTVPHVFAVGLSWAICGAFALLDYLERRKARAAGVRRAVKEIGG